MTNKRSIGQRGLALFGAGFFVSSLAAQGCSGKSGSSDKSDGKGNGGASPSGGSSPGGSSSGTSPAGGASGVSTGATGGSSGTNATGGGAGESGGESSGGTSGEAGSGMGGSGGSGGAGQGGTSGSGAAGMTGTLGERCSPRGALACAGNHQKLSVLCGGDDTWQPNQTCGTDEFCDSTPGPNVGTCQPVAPGCEDGPATEPWCADDDKTLVTCGPDAVTTPSTVCPLACHNGECRDDVGECPVWENYQGRAACAAECGAPAGGGLCMTVNGCPIASISLYPAIVRTPWTEDACACETGRRFVIILSGEHEYVRATVPEPWGFAECGEVRSLCQILSPNALNTRFVLSTKTDSGPVNVVLEEFDEEPSCPQ